MVCYFVSILASHVAGAEPYISFKVLVELSDKVVEELGAAQRKAKALTVALDAIHGRLDAGGASFKSDTQECVPADVNDEPTLDENGARAWLLEEKKLV